MAEWWSNLETLEKIYWCFALPSSAFFVILLIVSFIAGDVDDVGGADTEVDADIGIPFQFFTLKNLTGFFTIFGWSGLACLDSGLSNGASIAISVVCGLIMMVLMAVMFYYLSKMTESGTLNSKNAINGIGETYLPIPSKRQGVGKIQIRIQGSLRELEAITDSENEIKTGTLVTVVDVVNGDILVVKPNG